MRISLLQTGKTKDSFVREGVGEFQKRLTKYVPFRMETTADLKNSRNMTMKEVMQGEAKQILKKIRPGDHVILLDERGRTYDSIGFARRLNDLEGRTGHLWFVIGGPFGFSKEVYDRADERISLSKLTFSHQLVRLVFMEQLYRAFTILKGEPYHHA